MKSIVIIRYTLSVSCVRWCLVILFTIHCSLFTASAQQVNARYTSVVSDNTKVYPSKRPPVAERLFTSDAVEAKIREVQKLLSGNPRLAWMFANCFPNTLESTVHYRVVDGEDDTFVYTGDRKSVV